MKKSPDKELSAGEVHKREKDVLAHFLTSKPDPHKPLGKTAQAKRRKREKKGA
jgi:hypothetical protein